MAAMQRYARDDYRIAGCVTKPELTDVYSNYASRNKFADERGRQVRDEQERLLHCSSDLKDLVACGTAWLRDVRSEETELTAQLSMRELAPKNTVTLQRRTAAEQR
jgi:hypothetical protein